MSESLNFVENSPEKLLAFLLGKVEAAAQEPLYPGDERRILTEALSYALAVLVSDINENCKARTTKYATGYMLDALGARYRCVRLSPEPASTTLEFRLAAARSVDTVVPGGTRCTSEGSILFATDRSVTIPAGQMAASVPATATRGGIDTNGIPVGTVQTFVDDVPFAAGVTNLTESSGGSAGEPYPDSIDPLNGDDGTGDNHYRERIELAPSKFSTAGPESAYVYHVLTASANVSDVKVISEREASRVDVFIVELGGALPAPITIERVAAALTPKDVRPLNDLVVVQAPETVNYSIKATYYCTQADESQAAREIEEAGGAIARYIAWQDSKIGQDINPDQLRALCLGSCTRLDLQEPIFTSLKNNQIARFTGDIEISHIVEAEK